MSQHIRVAKHILHLTARGSPLAEALAGKRHHPAVGFDRLEGRAACCTFTTSDADYGKLPPRALRINVARAARLRNMWGVAGRGREPYATA